MKAIIFGTGSIACRHSRILNELGYEVIGVSSRKITLNDIYHSHKFSKVLDSNNWQNELSDIYVIASSTSLHTKISKELIEAEINLNRIFCEKPGPIEFLGINILYNLEYLAILNDIDLGPPIKILHCADARSWPSNINWKDRYVFNNNLGGGVFLTHSHELVHCFNDRSPQNISYKRKKFIIDKNGYKLCTFFKGKLDDIELKLDLISEQPIRYWQHQNYVLHFYGNIPKILKSEKVIKITNEMIENSYLNMWKSILDSTNVKLKKDFTWIHKSVR